jgi:4-hydroxy-tetrahydrodipicolinate synthase
MNDLPAGVSVLAGDDLYAGPLQALGAHGAILACGNVAARDYADLIAAWQTGPVAEARRTHDRLAPLTRALFAEPNPVVIKAVLAVQGRIPTADVRLPLLPSSPVAAAAALELLGQLR